MRDMAIAGAIGELLSWAGFIVGVPLLVAALILHSRDRARRETSVTIIEDLESNRVAIWSADGRTYSRILTAQDRLTIGNTDTCTGYVSRHSPQRLDLHKRSHAARACTTLAIITLSTGTLGFLASLVPMLL